MEPSPSIVAARKYNAANSPLFKLPAELRNKIYDYALSGHVYNLKYEREYLRCSKRRSLDGDQALKAKLNEDGFSVTNQHTRDDGMALLKTCWQIRGEARLVPYQRNTFMITSETQFSRNIFGDAFALERIGVIRNLCVQMQPEEFPSKPYPASFLGSTKLITALKDLRTVYFTFLLPSSDREFKRLTTLHCPIDGWLDFYSLWKLSNLARLPVENAHVTVNDSALVERESRSIMGSRPQLTRRRRAKYKLGEENKALFVKVLTRHLLQPWDDSAMLTFSVRWLHFEEQFADAWRGRN